MKRAREPDLIKADCEEAFQKWRDFCKEFDAHPDTVIQVARERRQKLEFALPLSLTKLLLDEGFPEYGTLTRLEVDCELEDESPPIRSWVFEAVFSNRTYGTTVDLTSEYYPADSRCDDFVPVDFELDPRTLWDTAMAENDNHPGRGLAAFCYACGERLGDYTANPAAAFPAKKAKDEVSA